MYVYLIIDQIKKKILVKIRRKPNIFRR